MKRLILTAVLALGLAPASDACVDFRAYADGSGAPIDSVAARIANTICNVDTDSGGLAARIVVSLRHSGLEGGRFEHRIEVHSLPHVLSQIVRLGPKAGDLAAAYATLVAKTFPTDRVTVVFFTFPSGSSRLVYRVETVEGKLVATGGAQ